MEAASEVASPFVADGWEATYDAEVAAVFLASSAAASVTDERLFVDGGHALHGPISELPSDGHPERLHAGPPAPTQGPL